MCLRSLLAQRFILLLQTLPPCFLKTAAEKVSRSREEFPLRDIRRQDFKVIIFRESRGRYMSVTGVFKWLVDKLSLQ